MHIYPSNFFFQLGTQYAELNSNKLLPFNVFCGQSVCAVLNPLSHAQNSLYVFSANELTCMYVWWCYLQNQLVLFFASTATGPKWEVKSKWKSTCNTYKIWFAVMFWGWPLKQFQPWNIIFELLNDIEVKKRVIYFWFKTLEINQSIFTKSFAVLAAET